MTMLIRDGTVVNATGRVRADVLVDGERVVALVTPGDTRLGHDLAATADVVIDAAGKYVVPGGVDCHTHMELPFGGTVASDTFATGTRAAAWGGTTTIVDFAVQHTGERVPDTLAAWHAKAEGACAIDYGFHQIIGGVDADSLDAMTWLVDQGVTSIKLFMAYPGVQYSDDGQILRAMQRAADLGIVVMMHAENGIAIDVLVAQALARGETAPVHHGLTRPWETEEEATHRAIMLARISGAMLYVVHMTAAPAVEQVAHARGLGMNVHGETCPQYLYLSLEDNLAAPGFQGAAWVCSPPLRRRSEGHQEALWRALRTGDLSVVSTDHAPFNLIGQKDRGRDDFTRIPNGIGSVEHRLDLVYQGVVDGRMRLERWVEVTSTAPARLFGLDGVKGMIAPGADADIVVYDPAGHTSIGVGKTHHMQLDHSAWEGFEIDGHVDTVVSRGHVVVRDGEFTGQAGHGRFLHRGRSAYVG